MSFTPPEPLSPDHDLEGFDSGQPSLDGWLTARARKNEKIDGSRTYVVRDGDQVVAYYCLSTGAVAHVDAPGKIKRNMPDPIPVMLMGRLAVAKSHQGKGLARGLMRDALMRTLQAAEIAGIKALLVHAIDEDSARFYRHLGFLNSPVNPMMLMLPMATARAALEPDS